MKRKLFTAFVFAGMLAFCPMSSGRVEAAPSNTSDAVKDGWVTIGDNRYYFSYSNYAAVTGWKRIGGKVYYFNADGTLKKMSGVVTASGGYRYYLRP